MLGVTLIVGVSDTAEVALVDGPASGADVVLPTDDWEAVADVTAEAAVDDGTVADGLVVDPGSVDADEPSLGLAEDWSVGMVMP